MLKGRITAKLDNAKSFVYYFVGEDTPTSIYGRISSNDYDALHFLAGDYDDNNALQERKMIIGLNSVKVSRATYINDKGKKKNYEVNHEFFLKLGALIRYAKTMCNQSNADGSFGLGNASGEFVAEPVVKYIIPMGILNKTLGTVELRLGAIQTMFIENDSFKIELEEDGTLPEDVFGEIKSTSPKGFMFSEDFLDFPVKQALDSQNVSGLYRDLQEVIAAHPEKELEWLLSKNYYIVSDDMLDDLCKEFMETDDYVYFDTETTGLDINFKSRTGQADQCVGLILSKDDGVSYFFPMQMKAITNLCNGDHFFFMEKYMKPILENKRIVAHNASFDWKVAYIYDINTNIVDDTMAMLALTLAEERENFPIGLKDSAKLLLHRDSLELSDLVVNNSWGESDIRFWDLPEELVKLYACADTDNTRGVHRYFLDNDILQKYNATRVYRIEVQFTLAVGYQEFYGHHVDVERLPNLKEEIEKQISTEMDKMVEIVGHQFNPNSSPQLLKIMYEELGIPTQISRKTGRPTTDKDTLKDLAERTDINGEPMYPFVGHLKKFREAEGIRKIIAQYDTMATTDGYLFSSVMQYGTTTGRVSINKPNYQSYNDAVKKYVCPRPGFYMADTDYSSVEYRVLANMAGNETIKNGFIDPDFDYHTYQAARMYGVPYAAVTPTLRKAAKGINFGIPYGMGDESLGVRVYGSASPENTAKAAKLRDRYLEGQDDIRYFFDNVRDGGVKNGYTETYFGRRRHYRRGKFTVNAIRRQAGNAVIQGCLGGDTRIMTHEFGIVKLKDVAGTRLSVWNGEKWSNGDVTYSGKKQKCIVHFKGGQSMICSPIHKFLAISHRGGKHWVECQNLHGSDKFANPHRIAINQEYKPAAFRYSSEEAYKYKSMAHNSRNVFLENVEDSFKLGTLLGRLASDGSYAVRTDGGSYIQQFVAEHEFSILPELRECMEKLGYAEKVNNIREERHEEVRHLLVHSSSLAHEINDLDIKHKVHDNIFMDTEVLRGFLRGFFDGDGGITGKTITLVFGTQYDFEPMCLDIQKALLFFGIRSNYRKYDDRYVIQVKTNDNQRFLDVIGFMNTDKQFNGRLLECVTDEHIFGKCLVVESVEITDEYIDMYDVCNTDDGYYVADGVITHNTAADIYKLAVGRVFARICKEGWLGKVLIPGFIHDEMLLEVHRSIDPMKFLKVLREEFEVKIKGWCPLYMGFGFGMSWYEAKKTEIPIQLQWEMVNKWGETGYYKWHQDGYELYQDVLTMLRDFSVRHCADQITSEDAQGKEIKPATNSALVDVCKTDVDLYESVIKGILKDNNIPVAYPVSSVYNKDSFLNACEKADIDIEDVKSGIIDDKTIKGLIKKAKINLDIPVGTLEKDSEVQTVLRDHLPELNEKLHKEFIGDAITSGASVVIDLFPFFNIALKSKKDTIDTQLALDLFCAMHGIDRANVNVKSIDTTTEVKDESVMLGDVLSFDENEAETEEQKAVAINARVKSLGMYLDTENNVILLQLLPNQWLELLRTMTTREQKGYRIRFRDFASGKDFITDTYVAYDRVTDVQSLYIRYLQLVQS